MGDDAIHKFKEDVDIQLKSAKAVCKHFPNKTIYLETILTEEGKSFSDWLKMDKADRTKYKNQADELNMAMLLINGVKNIQMKHDYKQNFAHRKLTLYNLNTPEEVIGM